MTERDTASFLLSAEGVRNRAQKVLALAEADALDHLSVRPDRLDAAAELVADVTREAYPDLAVPFHARWRHIETGGFDRWGAIADALATKDPRAYGRAAFDLAILSVLLDAGAGAAWRYRESATNETWERSEGLAVASVDMFRSGLFSGVPLDPFRADAGSLAALDETELSAGFQAGDDNPLVGLDGRTELLRALGTQAASRPDLFALEDDPRPGGLYDALVSKAEADGSLPAATILKTVLDGLGPIWPGRTSLEGQPLGDTWSLPALGGDMPEQRLVPFHKLSQWLSYSLIEPLQWTGISVTDIGGLTGLAEYRNGGLFLDTGVLTLKDPSAVESEHTPGDPLIVEWRALTVALLDRIADPVRTRLGVAGPDFPLARILEGGTWSAGRRLARQKRPGAAPPLRIASDGTVF